MYCARHVCHRYIYHQYNNVIFTFSGGGEGGERERERERERGGGGGGAGGGGGGERKGRCKLCIYNTGVPEEGSYRYNACISNVYKYCFITA